MHFPRKTNLGRSGFTLVELVVSVGVGLLIIMAVMYALIFCCRSFLAMGNYMDLNKASLKALDQMSRDIREVRQLQSYATNQLVFLDLSSNQLTYAWNPDTKQVTRTLSGNSSVLLKSCDYLLFNISTRAPRNDGTFGFNSATNNATICKLVDVSWRCSRKIYGYKINTESVQTAKICMRN